MNFADRVKEYFGYFESEFGFHLTSEYRSQVRSETDGAVEYISDKTGILIDSETGYVSIRIYRIQDGKEYYVTPVDIYEYLHTSNDEKELLLSTKIEDRDPASILFKKKFLLNQPGWQGSRGTVDDVKNELKNYSSLLKEYADLCLKGDLSWWIKFYEYKILRARVDHIRRGDDQLEFVQVKGIDGKWKLIKQPVFMKEMDYIKRIKNEL